MSALVRQLLALFAVVVLAAGCSGGAPVAEVDGPSSTLSAEQITDGLVAHRPAVPGVHGLVTAGHPLASMAGMRVLMQGGRAADAAVAVLATLNQVEPMMSGAGGNGFVTIYDAGTGHVHSLNATGAAPQSLDAAAIDADELDRGIKAGVVPGLLGGWIALVERFGTMMTLGEVLEPAIEYAELGHPLDPLVAGAINRARPLFAQYPSTAAVFLPDGAPPVAGQRVTYPDLARTFHKLVEAEETARLNGASREAGLRAAFTRFYRGDIAREMSRFYQEHDGLFTRADCAEYEPIWAEPVHTTYRGYDVYSSPATSRGGLEVLMQLNLVEGFEVASMGHNSPAALHLIVESIKLAKADVYHYVTDPAHATMPTAGMTSKAFAATRRALISPNGAMPYPDPGTPPGATVSASSGESAPGPMHAETSSPGSTTSFSIVDREGNVVVATPTLGSRWGTGVVVGSTGLLFNNGTRIGSTSPYPDDLNYVRGGQIPILNNSPTLVMKDGQFVLALGTPGGETIGQTQLQALLNVIDFGMGIQEAIEAPRISLGAHPNFYTPGADLTVRVESRVAPLVMARLVELGHDVETVPEYSIGSMQGILRNPETNTLTAGADPRRMMYAIGW